MDDLSCLIICLIFNVLRYSRPIYCKCRKAEKSWDIFASAFQPQCTVSTWSKVSAEFVVIIYNSVRTSITTTMGRGASPWSLFNSILQFKSDKEVTVKGWVIWWRMWCDGTNVSTDRNLAIAFKLQRLSFSVSTIYQRQVLQIGAGFSGDRAWFGQQDCLPCSHVQQLVVVMHF